MKFFYAFTLDTTNQCLWRGEERVSLPPKAFDVLRYLVEHADRLVTHDEILEALWTDTYVNQEVVKKYILGIRKVLGDRRDQPQFIRTFPKRGYQFVAPLTDVRQLSTAAAADMATAFVDRRTVRGRIEACLTRAAGGIRQVIFLTGEAGVGKTTFVDLFVQRAGLSPEIRIARGQCIEGFGGQEPYYPVLEAVDQLVRRSGEKRLVQMLTNQAPTWAVQFASLMTGDQRDALRRDTLGTTRERMVREVCEWLEEIAAQRPLILVLEDLHWADPATLDLVSTFARRREPARVLLLLTQRPSASAPNSVVSRLRQDLAIHGLCEPIPLEPFETSEVAEYLRLQFADSDFAADLPTTIHRHCGGNALFVSALVRDLIAHGTIVLDGAQWRLTVPVQSIEPHVPASLQDMLNVQFDQLSDAERRVLRAASVVGDRFPASMVANEIDRLDDVESVCEGLAERRLFIRASGMAELPSGTMSAYYEFHHALYRQAIYRRLSDVARSRLHRGAADRLEALLSTHAGASAAEIALHFENAHEPERAIGYLVLAAGNAARRFAIRDSLDVLQHAMGLVPRVPSDRRTPLEIRILERIGDAHYAMGAMVESALTYETASRRAAAAGLTTAQVEAQSCFARPLALLDSDRAIAVLQEAARVSATLGNPATEARVRLLAAGTRLLYGGWDANDVQMCDAAFQVVGAGDNNSTPGFDRMIYAHVQALQGHPELALNAARDAIPRSNEAIGVLVHLFALSAEILALLQLGRFGDALAVIRTSQETARKNGSDPWLFLYREAWLRTLAMDFRGAQQVCDEVLGSSAYPTAQAKTIARLAAGLEALEHGRSEEARREFEDVRDPVQTPNFFLHWYWRVHAHVGLVRALLQSARLVDARLERDRLMDSALRTGDPNLHVLAWEATAQLAMAESDWTAARRCIDHAFAALARFDVPISAWRIHATASELDQKTGHFDEAAVQRARARAHITALADSFAPRDPLRSVMLNAASVRRVYDNAFEMES